MKKWNIFISASTVIQNVDGLEEVIAEMATIYNVYILSEDNELEKLKEILLKTGLDQSCAILEKSSFNFQLEGINIGLVDNSISEIKTDLNMGLICLGVLFSKDKRTPLKKPCFSDEIKIASNWLEVSKKFIR